MKFPLNLPVQHPGLCSVKHIPTKNLKIVICEITLTISIKRLQGLGAPKFYSNYSLTLFQKDMETHAYYNSATNLHMKNSVVERFDLNCGACNVSKSQDLALKVCKDLECRSEVADGGLLTNETLYFYFGYQGFSYNFDREIEQVRAFVALDRAGLRQASSLGFSMRSVSMGTTPGKLVGTILIFALVLMKMIKNGRFWLNCSFFRLFE